MSTPHLSTWSSLTSSSFALSSPSHENQKAKEDSWKFIDSGKKFLELEWQINVCSCWFLKTNFYIRHAFVSRVDCQSFAVVFCAWGCVDKILSCPLLLLSSPPICAYMSPSRLVCLYLCWYVSVSIWAHRARLGQKIHRYHFVNVCKVMSVYTNCLNDLPRQFFWSALLSI